MREEGIKRFLEALGIDRIRMYVERGWVNSPCPLAPYTHAGGADVRPSFGIHVNEDGHSAWWCFGCSPKGQGLGKLLHNVWVADGRYPYEAARIFAMEEFWGMHVDDDETIPLPDRWLLKPPVNTDPLPPEVLCRYPLLQGKDDFEARRITAWLQVDRNVPVWVQNMCRLRYHYANQSVIFPMTDVRGNVFVLRERVRKEKRMWTINPELARVPGAIFPKLKDVGVWFGMGLVNWTRPVMLVEGEIDAMRVMALGFFNVLASCTSSVTEAQMDALAAHTLVLGFDADKGGDFARSRVVDRLSGRCNMLVADWSVAKKDDASDCKDAGDLPDKDALSLVLENLESV
jgi:hypothetical protein